MFLSVGHEKNVIYSKLVNNPFNEREWAVTFIATGYSDSLNVLNITLE